MSELERRWIVLSPALVAASLLGACLEKEGGKKTSTTTTGAEATESPATDTNDTSAGGGTTDTNAVVDTGESTEDDSTFQSYVEEACAGDVYSDDDALCDSMEAVFGTDPFNVDTDADELWDDLELFIVGTNPVCDDTDGDSISDGDEYNALYADPLYNADVDRSYTFADCPGGLAEQDADNDGLTLQQEMDCGTSDEMQDTDNDGLSDAVECESDSDTSAFNQDTDGDGVEDGIEVQLGTSPTSADEVPNYASWNRAAVCEAEKLTEASGANFDGGNVLFYAGTFSRDSTGGMGSECVCTFDVAGVGSDWVTGISVWTEQSAHEYTDGMWNGNPVPMGVLATMPWVPTAPGLSLTSNGESGLPITAGGAYDDAGQEIWAAFEGNDGFAFPTAVTLAGTAEVRVSWANLSQIGIKYCDELAWNGTHGLHFRIDSVYAARALSSALPARDPMACVAGQPNWTEFGFVPGPRNSSTPVPVAGAARFAGASATHIQVQQWNGTEQLIVRHMDGREVRLSPDTSAASLPGAPWSLEDLRYYSQRTSEGAYKDPVIAVSHHCPAGGPTLPPPTLPSYHLRPLDLDQLAAALGIELRSQSLMPSLTDEMAATPIMRARLVLPATFVPGPSQASLRLDVAGGETLALLPIRPKSETWLTDGISPPFVSDWVFSWSIGGLLLQGQLSRTPQGLEVTLQTPKGAEAKAAASDSPQLKLTLSPE